MNSKFFLFLLGVLLSVGGAQESHAVANRLPQVAVYELNHDASISKAEADAILNRFQTELINTGKFSVLERAKISAILEEQAFSQSGTCSEESCMLEVGQLLGVEKMVYGSLNSVGSIKTLNMGLIDITTGKIEQSHALDVKGGIEEILTVSARGIARKMAGLKEEKKGITVSVDSGDVWWITGVSVLGAGLGVGIWYFFFNEEPAPEKISRTETITITP